MFTYVYLGTNDLVRACRFYDATMGTLGFTRCDVSGESSWEGVCGWRRTRHRRKRHDGGIGSEILAPG